MRLLGGSARFACGVGAVGIAFGGLLAFFAGTAFFAVVLCGSGDGDNSSLTSWTSSSESSCCCCCCCVAAAACFRCHAAG